VSGARRSSIAGGLLCILALTAVGCSGGSGGSGGLGPAPGPVTLSDVQTLVFSPRCATSGCHIGPGAQMGMDLSAGASASNILGVPSAENALLLLVEPFDAANSYLYRKVSGIGAIEGDPMPADGTVLSGSQIALIEDWINQGAVE